MTHEDRARWDRLNWQARTNRAALPCGDCTPEFAAEMRAEFRCNGFPGMTGLPRPEPTPGRRHSCPPEVRRERRRASWRAYRERVRVKATP